MPKKYDVAVVTGEYTDRNTGEVKKRWQNIGAVMTNDKGEYMLLDPLVNLAAIQREPGKDRVICSLFAPRDEGQQQPANAARTGAVQDEEIPF